jgi:DNA-binding XRE family transcriptional regulator
MLVHKALLCAHVGEQFRAVRQNNKLSQEELGKLIDASKQQISKYEKAVDTLVQLLAAPNIPLSFSLKDMLHQE